MPKSSKKISTSSDSRDRILKSAVILFSRFGYGNTGLRKLAHAADVNLAMINYFFGSKKELLKEIIDLFFSGYLEVARKELSGSDAPLIKIDRFIHSAVFYFSVHRDYLLITITELPHDDPEITEYKADWGKQMAEIVGKNIVIGSGDSDEESRISPVIFCSTLTSLMASRFLFAPIMNQIRPKEVQETSMEEYADIISNIFLRGVGKNINRM